MKNIQLTTEQALELYKTNPEYRDTLLSVFTDEELNIKPMLRDWEDLDFLNTYYPQYSGKIYFQTKRGCIESMYLQVPSEKHAKSMIAFAKLSMLMNDLGDECRMDWENKNQTKYVVFRYGNILAKDTLYCSYTLLAFKTKSIRDAFFEKHHELIKEYFML